MSNSEMLQVKKLERYKKRVSGAFQPFLPLTGEAVAASNDEIMTLSGFLHHY